MRRYARISTSLWVSSKKWRKLGHDNEARLLYFYLHTCTHNNSIGTYVMPMHYLCADLGWPEETARAVLSRLESVALVVYDDDESIVHLPGAMTNDPATNSSHAKGMESAIRSLPNGRTKDLCIAEFVTQKHYQEPTDTLLTDSLHPTDTLLTPCPEPADRTGKGKVKVQALSSCITARKADEQHIGQQVNDLWTALKLPKPPRRYDWLQGGVKLTTLTADYSDAEILAGVQKLAVTPGLSWAASKGPSYLSEQCKGGLVLQVVLDYKDFDTGTNGKHQPATTTTHPKAWKLTETTEERARRIVMNSQSAKNGSDTAQDGRSPPHATGEPRRTPNAADAP